jgi:hypothetical protein
MLTQMHEGSIIELPDTTLVAACHPVEAFIRVYLRLSADKPICVYQTREVSICVGQRKRP